MIRQGGTEEVINGEGFSGCECYLATTIILSAIID